MTPARSVAPVVAACATLLTSILSARAIIHAQWGPTWEIPARVVMELAVAQLASFVLLPIAIGALVWHVWAARGFAAPVLLGAQAVIAEVLAYFASPDQAALWPTRHPPLSRHIEAAMLVVTVGSVVLGALGALISGRVGGTGQS